MVNDANNRLHILVIEDESGRRTLALEEVKYTIGRKFDNQIILHSKQASRRHATLVKKGADRENFSYWILDGDLEGNKSHNGLYVNGTKCLVHELKNGDLINFGCEVNASYHSMAPQNEPAVAVSGPAPLTITRPEESSDEENLHLKSTLILDHNNPLSFSDTMHDRAYLDILTGLPNRYLFNEHLFIAINNAFQQKRGLGLLLIDLENFKEINNKLEYRIGDKILQALSVRLKEGTRSGDIVARWGGDEFIVLLPQITETSDLDKIVSRISRSLFPVYKIENHTISAPVTVASVLYPRDGSDDKTLVKQLENNQQQLERSRREALAGGRPGSENKVDRVTKLEYLLRKAIDQDELSLYFQPQVNIRKGEVEGLEVLLRWKHPQYGPIAPSRFLPLLEETDSIFLISHWVLQQTCQQAARWREDGLLYIPISINVSPRQLHDPRFPEMVARVLAETGIQSGSLEIEMTETNFLEHRTETYRIVHELQQIGVGLSLDDFGIGQASIGYLGELPLGKLKVAQDLVKNVDRSPQNRIFVAAALALGKCFRLTVIAEGVETRQQLEILQELGCERIQGNLISLPLPAVEIAKFLGIQRGLLGG